MAKKSKHRYKDAKRDDRFHEALDNVWARIWPHTWIVGIALALLLVAVIAYIIINRQLILARDTPWRKRFEIQRDAEEARRNFGPNDPEGRPPPKAEEAEKKVFQRMRALADEYPGHGVSAMLLLELSSMRLTSGARDRMFDANASRAHFAKAAEAAERFAREFPAHRLIHIASYNAGKARLELEEYSRAAEHFQLAQDTTFPFLAALAKLLRARCYEELGRRDEARGLYREVMNDRMASWCAQQAQFHLTQIDRRPAKGG